MRGSDEMFKMFDERYYINPYNIYDPTTPYGREQLSAPEAISEPEDGKETLKGWRRIFVIAFIIGFIILAGIWQP